jgi:GNAT superfamily N-acetyltransferase
VSKVVEHDIRYTQVDDEKFLFEVLSDKKINRWFPVSNKAEIRPFVRNWIGFHKFRSSLTATVKDIPCGIGTLFLMPYKKICHQCFFYLVVDSNHQNKGIGKSLVKNLINLSKNYFNHEQLYVEIFEGCVIEKLLIALDFKKFVEQKGYVMEGQIYKSRICYELIF